MGNIAKTAVLMAAITAILVGLGQAIGGQTGAIVMLLFAAATNFFSYWFSDKMVLKMYKAREVDAATAPQFYGMIQELAQRAELPMPKVYIIDEAQPNAFATGRNPSHAAVAATSGILELLTERELRGVMAHELAHVKHRDILISTISATMAGSISALARFAMIFGGSSNNRQDGNPIVGLLVAILAPLAAAMIQMAISRTREYGADKGGSEISGDPLALAAALEKIEHYARNIVMPTAERNPTTAQMMIINPLSAHQRDKLFSTHPSTANRIAKLQELARHMGSSVV
ncbi:MAG: zinc metalloprotease HtpX [Saezia sp.]